MVKLKKGSSNSPRLLDLSKYWSKISYVTNTVEFEKELQNQMEDFINTRKKNCKNISSDIKYNKLVPIWKYSTNLISFKKYRSNLKNKLNYYRIPRACHWLSPLILIIMKKLDPSQKWIICEGDFHSAVGNQDLTIIVDILAKPYNYKNGIEVLNAIYKN